MIDSKKLEQQCSGKWHGILTTLGVPESFLTGKHRPCLFCGGKDRWRWDNKDGNGAYICGQCGAGTGFMLVMKFLNINFPEAIEIVQNVVGGCKMEPTSIQDNERTKQYLNELWTSSKPLTGSDPVCKYLHKRGLVLQPDFVRYCPECYESETKKSYPALVAKILNKDN